MKTSILLMICMSASIGACATLPTERSAAYDDGVDHASVASINQAARANGIEVHWMNYPPRRPTPVAGDLPARTDPGAM